MATSSAPSDRLPQIKVMLYTSKTLANGSHPLRLRITKDGGRKYISIGKDSPLQWWDSEKELPRRSHPQQKELLALIKKWETSYADAAKLLHDTGHPFTVDMIVDAVTESNKKPRKERKGVMILSYLQDLYEQFQAAKQIGNSNVYRDTRRVLAKFLDNKDCPMSTVNVLFLNKFETFLRGEGCADTTLSVYFRTLRAAINRAIAEKLLPADLYPFSRHTSQRDKFSLGKFNLGTRKRAITKEDIQRIECLQPDTSRLMLAKHVFLFSYYGGGINYVDMAQLRWRSVQGGRLEYVRQKTGGLFNFKLPPAALAILDFYRPLTATNIDAYIFGILSTDRHQSPIQIANRLHKVKGQVNADLKVIAKLVGIETNLTTYVARHTFGTVLRKAGISDTTISQLYQHSTERTTKIYLNELESHELDEAFNNL